MCQVRTSAFRSPHQRTLVTDTSLEVLGVVLLLDVLHTLFHPWRPHVSSWRELMTNRHLVVSSTLGKYLYEREKKSSFGLSFSVSLSLSSFPISSPFPQLASFVLFTDNWLISLNVFSQTFQSEVALLNTLSWKLPFFFSWQTFYRPIILFYVGNTIVRTCKFSIVLYFQRNYLRLSRYSNMQSEFSCSNSVLEFRFHCTTTELLPSAYSCV